MVAYKNNKIIHGYNNSKVEEEQFHVS